MAGINRECDNSEKKEWLNWCASPSGGASYLGLGTGLTVIIAGPMPYPYTLQSVLAMSVGASGAPQLVMAINRNINTGGNTTIAVGISNYVIPNQASFQPIVGWSGLAAPGSTVLNGLMGDYIVASTAGANTACTQLMLNVVVKKTQDIVSHNGIST